jgi:hypothetical protein
MQHTSGLKGRVLRVKIGYNPNSSSVGSQIPTFFFSAVGIGFLAVIASQIFNMVKGHIAKEKDTPEIEKQK